MHRLKKTHQNVDELFKLHIEKNKSITNLLVAIISNDENLLQKIVIDFFENKTFQKMITKIKKLTKSITEKNSIVKYQLYR